MRLFFIAVLLFIGNGICYCQLLNNLNPGFNSPVPPSPSANALSKFGNIPVGYSTGIPEISVPVYKYAGISNGLSLSLSLMYHAGGVRVDEIASNIGIGWALNAGGVISRVVKGIPDECSGGFIGSDYIDAAGGDLPTNDPSFKPFTKAYFRTKDLEADIFTFNFNGRSGRFTYGRDGNVLIIDNQKVKIEKEESQQPENSDNMITKFIITDENGIKYFFEAFEKTQLNGVTFHNIFTSSWYLTKIKASVGSDEIVFEYDDVAIATYVTSLSENFVTNLYNGSTQNNSFSTATQLVNGKRIKQIILPNGLNVQFAYNPSARTDLPGDHLLSKILIMDPVRQAGFGVLLQQDYSVGNRATLLKVIPFSGLNSEIQESPYQFSYRTGLPPRLDNRQDHWGYPTFYPVTNTRIPREIFQETTWGRHEWPGVNRDTDPLGCLAGSLSKIIYPTGGRTEFDMEPNQAIDGWLSQNFSVVVNDPSYIDKTQDYSFTMSDVTTAFQDIYMNFNGEPDGPTQFALTVQPTTISGTCTGTCFIRVEIFPTTGNTQAALISSDLTTPLTASTLNFSVPNLVKGSQYRLRIYYTFSGINSYYAQARLGWKEKQLQTQHTEYYSHSQAYVGGLRVKKISDYDGISTDPVSIKQYDYVAENGVSSGILASYPTYSYKTRYEGLLNVNISNGGTYTPGEPLILVRQSSSVQDIIYTNGSPVCYSRVVEYFKNNNKDNGKIERLFTVRSAGSTWIFPFIPVSNLTWTYGLLTKEVVADANNNQLKITENTYQTSVFPDYSNLNNYHNFTSYTLAPVLFRAPDEYLANGNNLEDFAVANFPAIGFLSSNYRPLAGRSDILSSTVTEKSSLTGQSVTTIASYEYDPIFLYQKKKIVTDSKNQTLTETYTYPPDRVNAGQTVPYQEMVNRNIIAPVVEQVQNNQTLNRELGRLKTNYQVWQNNAFINPVSIQKSVAGNPLVTELTFDNYDANGNMTQSTSKNGIITSYVWGYKRQYPVAKVTGSAAVAVSSFINQSVLDNINSTYSDQQIRDESNKIRVGLGNTSALVSTYTYAPLTGINSETDAAGKSTYYEYDGFNRLKNVKDFQGNIVKNYQYNYINSCGANCTVLPMQTFTNYNTPGYPVGVFNVNKVYLGTANNASEYVSFWNNNAANQAIGTLSVNTNPLQFNLTSLSGAAIPGGLYGLRFYKLEQYYGSGIFVLTDALCYVDFGDGTKTLLPDNRLPVDASTISGASSGPGGSNSLRHDQDGHFERAIHGYSLSGPHTITVFHNETTEAVGFQAGDGDDLSHQCDITGNYPQLVKAVFNGLPTSSDIGVINFSTLKEVIKLYYGIYSMRHNSWQSVNNFHKLKWVFAEYSYASEIMSDLTSNFPLLEVLDLRNTDIDIAQIFSTTGFKNGYYFSFYPGAIPVDKPRVDLLLERQAAVTSQANGYIYINSYPYPGRTHASDAAYNQLLSANWNMPIGDVQ